MYQFICITDWRLPYNLSMRSLIPFNSNLNNTSVVLAHFSDAPPNTLGPLASQSPSDCWDSLFARGGATGATTLPTDGGGIADTGVLHGSAVAAAGCLFVRFQCSSCLMRCPW